MFFIIFSYTYVYKSESLHIFFYKYQSNLDHVLTVIRGDNEFRQTLKHCMNFKPPPPILVGVLFHKLMRRSIFASSLFGLLFQCLYFSSVLPLRFGMIKETYSLISTLLLLKQKVSNLVSSFFCNFVVFPNLTLLLATWSREELILDCISV